MVYGLLQIHLWLHESSSSPPPHAARNTEEHPGPWRDPPPGRRLPLRTTRLPTPRPRWWPFDGHFQMENDDKYLINHWNWMELVGSPKFSELMSVRLKEKKQDTYVLSMFFWHQTSGPEIFPTNSRKIRLFWDLMGIHCWPTRSWPTPNGEQRHIWENDQQQPLKTTFPPNGKNNNCLASYSMKKRESNLCPTLCQALFPSGPNRVGHKLLQ